MAVRCGAGHDVRSVAEASLATGKEFLDRPRDKGKEEKKKRGKARDERRGRIRWQRTTDSVLVYDLHNRGRNGCWTAWN